MVGSSIVYSDSDKEESETRNVMDIIGKIEQPLFFPPFDVSDLLSTSSLQSYRFLSADTVKTGKHEVFPTMDEVCTPITPLSSTDIESMLEGMNCEIQEGEDMAWLPNWIDKTQLPVNEKRSYDSYLRLWRQLLTCLSCTDESSHFQRKRELHTVENELVRWAGQVDFTCIPEDVQSIQCVLEHFDVFKMTENKQSRVALR